MRRAGFTLIELLISLALLGMVVAYLLETFAVQHKTYTVVDQVTEAQQNLRAVGELLERDVRHAGLMVPEAASVCGIDQTNAPDTLYVSDADAIVPGTDKTPDFGASLPLGVTNVATGVQNLALDDVVVEPNPFRAAYDLDGDGTNDSDFRQGAGVIVTDPDNPDRGAACGVVTANPAGTTLPVNIQSAALAGGPSGRLVVVPAHEYRVNNQQQLLRNGTVLAEGVEDLQVAYFFDDNANGQVDPGEVRGDGVGADYLAEEAGRDESDIRAVRVNLVFRTRLQDIDNSQGLPQATENRAPSVVADGFRRRVQTANVRLRNVGSR